ncbi:unnamed protein product [Cunninghamella echinulata]
MPIERNKISKSRPKQHTSPLRNLLNLSPTEALLLEACALNAIFLSDTTLNPDTIRDIYLRTPLHIACSRKDDSKEAAAIVRLLIKQGADVNNGVGDIDGLKPMHIAVLNGNYHCIIVLLEEAKLKLDNLKQLPSSMDNSYDHLSERDTKEYQDLLSITQVLIEHLANKHLTTSTIQSKIPSSSYYGLSEHLFSKTGNDEHLNDTILSITDQLSNLGVDDTSNQIRDDLDVLIAKIRELGVQEKK